MIPSPHNTYKYLKQVYPVDKLENCDWTTCWDIKHDCGFVFRVPILNHSLEVVIRNLTFLHVSTTGDNIFLPPFGMNITKGNSRSQVEKIGMRTYKSTEKYMTVRNGKLRKKYFIQ